MASNLIAHCGARIVERAELEKIEPPSATPTWVPIKHSVIMDRVGKALSDANFSIRAVKTAVSRGDQRLFATIDTSCGLAGGDVTLAVAVVNSTDKSLPMKMIAGNRVMACDNLALRSDLMSTAVVRKHSKFGLDRFQEALLRAVSHLDAFKIAEAARIKRFMHSKITDTEAEALMLRSYERGVIGPRLLPRLIQEWRNPSFEEFEPRTLWSLENAHTTVLADVAKANPHRFCALSVSLQALLGEAAGVRPEETVPALSA